MFPQVNPMRNRWDPMGPNALVLALRYEDAG